jgi:hypothetical protein
MIDNSNTVHCLGDHNWIGQASLDQFGGGIELCEVRPQAGAEIIQNADRPTLANQFLGQV